MTEQMKDRRVIQAFPDKKQQQYLINLERRVGGLEKPDYSLLTPTFTIGTEASDAIAIGVQLKELDGTNPTGKRVVECWFSNDQLGAGSAINSTLTVDTGTELRVVTTRAWLVVLTDSSGFFRLLATDSTTTSRYLNVLWQDRLFASDVISWA